MRRILLTLLIAISSVLAVHAQGDETGGATVVRAEYFFDSDPGYGNATIINNVTEGDNALSLSVEDLSPGAHMLYVRSQASSGVWSSTQSHPLLLVRQRPAEAVRVEYFYDTDPGYGNGVSVGNLTDGDNTLLVSVAGLAYGVHHLCLRAQDNTGVWSQVATYSVFVTSPTTANAVRIEYFFDTDPGFGQATPITPSQDEEATYALSLDNLSMGAHMLYLRVQDNHGRWSSVQSHPIYVLNNLPDVVAVEYFFDDNDPGEGQATAVPLPSIKTDPFAFEANIAGLAPGEHHLMVRLKKNNGFWTLFDAATFTVEGLAEPEPYAVLTDNTDVLSESATGITYGKTLTFYYDTEKQARGGMDIGPFEADSLRGWHLERDTITKVVFDSSFASDTTVTSTAYWFSQCNKLTNIEGIANLKTDNVTNMREMFYFCPDLTTLDVSGFNTANVTNMREMFWGCGLTSLDLSNFNTANVTDMWGMFSWCSGLTSLDLSSFKTDNVTDMCTMFWACSSLTSLNVSGFNTANVTDMSSMFSDCSGLTSLDLSSFNTANVTDMWGMFYGCSGLTSLDVIHFNTANVTDMGNMFYGCSGLTTLGMSNFKTDNVADMSEMFRECSGLTSLDLSSFKTDNVTDMSRMFNGCSGLTSLDLSSFNTSKVTYNEDNYFYGIREMFSGCSNLTTIYVGDGWTTANLTESPNVFKDCTNLVGGMGTTYDANHADYTYAHIDGGPSNPGYFTDKNATPVIAEAYAAFSDDYHVLTFYYDDQKEARDGMSVGPFESDLHRGWLDRRLAIKKVVIDSSFVNNTSLTSTAYWFTNLADLTTIEGLQYLNTENVTTMREMFYSCSSLVDVDLSHLNTSNVTNMSGMFAGCSVENFDLSNFDTQNVTNMSVMFMSCPDTTSIDLTSFNTSKVTDMMRMFAGCKVKTIYVGSGWTTESVNSSSSMFNNCTKLVGGMGTVFDANHTDAEYAHIDGGPSNPGYFTDKNATPVIAEAYAALSDDNTVLTFYYDGQKSARNGLDLGPFSYPDYQSWSGQSRKITNVVFDASFADYAELSNTSYWFRNCANLTTITGIENLNTSNVEDMSSMFDGCAKLTGLDVSHFNTSKVTSFWGTFFGCRSLTSLDLSGFSTENVEYVNYMFDGCAGLTSLDLSSFSTPQLKYMYNMFDGCSNLMTIDMRNFTTARVTSMDDLFAGCTSLVAIHAGGANIPDSLYAGIGNPNLLVYVNDASVAPTSIQNVVVNGVAKEIVLTDEVGIYGKNNFFCPQAFTAEKISYTRNFTQHTQPNVSRGWESISLPFSVQNIVHESKGDLSPFGSPAEGKKFWLRRLADNGLTRASQIEANVPYVISMPNSTEYTDLYNLAGRVTFSSQYTTVPATTQQVLALADSSIVMMPTTLRVNRSSSVWAINVGEVRGQYLEGSVFERDYREVRPFEAYTVHRSNGPAPRFVPIIEMDADATGIEDVKSLMSDGRDDQWYDLKGNKLQQKPTHKGVYILNGAKVVVK